MGYFDSLASSLFKKDESGKSIFYPWGVFGKGRVLPDEETENRVRRLVIRFFMIGIILVLIVGGSVGWVYGFIPVVVFIAWYQFKLMALIAGCSVSHEKLTFREGWAKRFNKTTLWLMLILFSILFVAGGLLMFAP